MIQNHHNFRHSSPHQQCHCLLMTRTPLHPHWILIPIPPWRRRKITLSFHRNAVPMTRLVFVANFLEGTTLRNGGTPITIGSFDHVKRALVPVTMLILTGGGTKLLRTKKRKTMMKQVTRKNPMVCAPAVATPGLLLAGQRTTNRVSTLTCSLQAYRTRL